MCTVSVLHGPWVDQASSGRGRPAWRLVCSRDEQRSRPAARPPAIGRIGEREVASPIDPQGPGTWIAVSDGGLAFVLLNRTRAGTTAVPGVACPATDGRTTRGRIIPLLAGAASLDDVRVRARHLGPLHTHPFTLLVAGDRGVLEYVSDGDTLEGGTLLAGPRLLRTSSSVDEASVKAWRTTAFDTIVGDGDAGAQDAFHHVTDPDARHRGVFMARPDACTVSITRIDMFAGRVRVGHEAIAGATCTILEMARRP